MYTSNALLIEKVILINLIVQDGRSLLINTQISFEYWVIIDFLFCNLVLLCNWNSLLNSNYFD